MSKSTLANVLASQVLDKPIPASPIPVVLPDEDDDAAVSLDKLGYAEGQSFTIEYIDSARRPSTRRVTVWGLVAGSGGVPSLIAFCHERNAQRQFRVDRIQCFIDYDGEVFTDVSAFLAENFGMEVEVASKRVAAGDQRWKRIVETMKQDAVILSAISRSDHRVVSEETSVIAEHLSKLVESSGLMLDNAELLAINRYANRLRPTEEAILRALDHIAALGHRHVHRLLLAAVSVVDADRKRHPNEIALINDIAMDLTGTTVY